MDSVIFLSFVLCFKCDLTRFSVQFVIIIFARSKRFAKNFQHLNTNTLSPSVCLCVCVFIFLNRIENDTVFAVISYDFFRFNFSLVNWIRTSMCENVYFFLFYFVISDGCWCYCNSRSNRIKSTRRQSNNCTKNRFTELKVHSTLALIKITHIYIYIGNQSMLRLQFGLFLLLIFVRGCSFVSLNIHTIVCKTVSLFFSIQGNFFCDFEFVDFQFIWNRLCSTIFSSVKLSYTVNSYRSDDVCTLIIRLYVYEIAIFFFENLIASSRRNSICVWVFSSLDLLSTVTPSSSLSIHERVETIFHYIINTIESRRLVFIFFFFFFSRCRLWRQFYKCVLFFLFLVCVCVCVQLFIATQCYTDYYYRCRMKLCCVWLLSTRSFLFKFYLFAALLICSAILNYCVWVSVTEKLLCCSIGVPLCVCWLYVLVAVWVWTNVYVS